MSPFLTSLTSLASRAAISAPGRTALAALTLMRLSAARHRGGGLVGALEVARRARFLAERDQRRAARRLLSAGARRLRGTPEASVLAVEDAITALDAGEAPRPWLGALRTHLAIADRVWQEDGARAAGTVEELLSMTLRLVFHREVQFGDAAGSGGGDDPLAPLRALQASTCWQAVCGVRATRSEGGGQAADQPRRAASEPVRLAVVATENFTFVRDIIADYEADPRVQVQVLDLAEPGLLPAVPRPRDVLAARLRLAGGSPGIEAPRRVRETLEWADTILVEWGASAAAWVSLVSPTLERAGRVVVRLHSYEASTAWPHLTDWQAVDTLITVSPPILRLLEDTVPALAPSGSRPQCRVVPNRSDLARYDLPKEPGAERTLAMVGWAARRKDPAWALDVLDILRETDPTWRLLLIGPDFGDSVPAAQERYVAAVTERITALGEAVMTTGRTEEVPEHLRRAGVILSASRRESAHLGLLEGVASGALPVCRNWPDVAPWGGAAAIYPSSWIVDTPEQAAEVVLARHGDPDHLDAQRQWLLDNLGWSAVRPRLDEVLLDRKADSDPLS